MRVWVCACTFYSFPITWYRTIPASLEYDSLHTFKCLASGLDVPPFDTAAVVTAARGWFVKAGSLLSDASDVLHLFSPGVATLVAPAVRLLDKIYATRVTLEDLSSKYGDQPLQWPVHVVEQLRERNTAILAAIEGSICALPAGLYYPLGMPVPES